MEPLNNKLSKILLKINNDLSSGLLYTHTRINDNTKKVLGTTPFLYALIELLNEKGLVTIEDLNELQCLSPEENKESNL